MPSFEQTLAALDLWGRRHGVPFVRLPDAEPYKIVLDRAHRDAVIAALQAGPAGEKAFLQTTLPDRTRLIWPDAQNGQVLTLDLIHALSLHGLPYLTINAVLLRAVMSESGTMRPDAPDAGLILLFERLRSLSPPDDADLQRFQTAQAAGGAAFANLLGLLFGRHGERKIAAWSADRTGTATRALRRSYYAGHAKRHGVLALASVASYLIQTGWRHLDRTVERLLLDLSARDRLKEKSR